MVLIIGRMKDVVHVVGPARDTQLRATSCFHLSHVQAVSENVEMYADYFGVYICTYAQSAVHLWRPS